ncbi:MAG: ABC transporter substrate-binding protein [Candidatus Latescibacteria bacterium]|nr:ABC transporter substrate-binding protein [Candidatus Latescibacterota bacterium]
MRPTRSLLGAILAALVALPLAVRAAEPLRIGVAGPFTGSGAMYGVMIRNAATLALEEANAAGGIKGRTVEAEYGDDEGKNDKAVTVARKFATDQNICMVIGHFNSTCSLAGKPIYRDAEVVQFSPGSTNIHVCEGSDYTFRNLYRDDYQGTFMADYIKKILGLDRVAVFFDNDDYGKGLKDAFVKQAQAIGLQVVTTQDYVREKTSDFAPLLDLAKNAQAQAVFIAGLYAEAGTIVKQAREKGIKLQFLGGDGVFGPGFTEIGGQAAEGTLIVTPFLFGPTSSEPAKNFAAKFNKRFGREPDTWAALTYDAVTMALDGIRAVGPNRNDLRDWMAAHDSRDKGFKGITGVTYFDHNGDCLKPAMVALVEGGRFVLAPKQME